MAGFQDSGLADPYTPPSGTYTVNGSIAFGATGTPAAAAYGIGQDGSNLILGAPTAKGFQFNVNGAQQARISNVGSLTLGASPTIQPASGDLNIVATAANVLRIGNNVSNVTIDPQTSGTLTIAGGGASWATLTKQSTKGLNLQTQAADGASQIGLVIDNVTAGATAGFKNVSIQNAATEKFGFKWDSGLTFSTTIAPAAADYGISQDGSNLVLNAPTNKGTKVNINGATKFTVAAGAMTVAAGVGRVESSYTAQSANYTVLATDYIVIFTGSTAAQTITLPTIVLGARYIIKNRASVAVTLSAGGGQTIDGAASTSLAVNEGVDIIGGPEGATAWTILTADNNALI